MRSQASSRTRTAILLGLFLVCAAGTGGCNNAGEGALSGAALGAGAGAIIGSLYGGVGTGAAIGAVAGGLGGAVIGDQNDRRSRNYGAYPNSYSGGSYYYEEHYYRSRNPRHCDW